MQIHEVSPDELDFVCAICLNPSVPPRWREIMEPCMVKRCKWIKAMMEKGLQISVALNTPKAVVDSLGLGLKKVKAKTVKAKKSGKLLVDVFYNAQCPWSGWMVDKVTRGMKKYDAVVNAINTDDRKVIEEYGMSRGVSVNGKPVMKRMASLKEIESIVKQSVLH